MNFSLYRDTSTRRFFRVNDRDIFRSLEIKSSISYRLSFYRCIARHLKPGTLELDRVNATIAISLIARRLLRLYRILRLILEYP